MSNPPTSRTRVRRRPERGDYDRATIDAIVDEAHYCHVGVVHEGVPVVLPTIHWRLGDQLYVHGSAVNAVLKTAVGTPTICVTITLLDGLVLARSAFHHSMNYRSVVVFGPATLVEDREEKLTAFAALMESVVSGRGGDCRPPSDSELEATALVRVPLNEASAKIRGGPVADDASDMTLPHWAGVVPVKTVLGEPLAAAEMPSGTEVPAYLRAWVDSHK